MSTQALSALISSLSLLLVQTQAARWKAATPDQLTGAQLHLDIAKVRLPLSCNWECYVYMCVCMHMCTYTYICIYVCMYTFSRFVDGHSVCWTFGSRDPLVSTLTNRLLSIKKSLACARTSKLRTTNMYIYIHIYIYMCVCRDLRSQTSQLRILHSAEEDNLSPFEPKIACLCQTSKLTTTNTHTRTSISNNYTY